MVARCLLVVLTCVTGGRYISLDLTMTVKTFVAVGEGVGWSVYLVLDTVCLVPSTSTRVSGTKFIWTILSLDDDDGLFRSVDKFS